MNSEISYGPLETRMGIKWMAPFGWSDVIGPRISDMGGQKLEWIQSGLQPLDDQMSLVSRYLVWMVKS